jgi:hypothetical protein
MALHHEYLWLLAYMVIIVAAIVAAVASGFVWWIVLVIGVLGIPFAFLGWTWQVGRFG